MKIFISHASGDAKVAKHLASELAEAGYDVWNPDRSLLPGDNWALKSGQALEHAQTIIVLISPESVQSPWVQSEIGYALGSPNYADRLIPVVVRPTEEGDIPWILRRMHCIRANGNQRELTRLVLDELQRLRV